MSAETLSSQTLDDLMGNVAANVAPPMVASAASLVGGLQTPPVKRTMSSPIGDSKGALPVSLGVPAPSVVPAPMPGTLPLAPNLSTAAAKISPPSLGAAGLAGAPPATATFPDARAALSAAPEAERLKVAVKVEQSVDADQDLC